MNKSSEEAKLKDILLVYGSGECDQLGIDLEDAEDTIISVPSIIPNWSQTIKEVVCGGMHALVLTADGRVFSFGCNDDGALGRPQNDTQFIKEIPFDEQVTALSAGDSHSVAVTINNKLFAWGLYKNSLSGLIGEKIFEPRRVGKFELARLTIRKIASGVNHTLVLAGKKIFSWGDPETGSTGRQAGYNLSKLTSRRKNTQSLRIEALKTYSPVDVWAGAYCSFYKDSKGRMYSFGLNNYGQLGIGSTKDKYEPTLMKEAPEFSKIVGGEHHVLGLTEEGEVYGWGRNDDGQLGIENEEDQVHFELPQKIEGIKQNVRNIVVGNHYNYAVTENKKLYSWGCGDQYVLGTESEETIEKPYRIASSFFPKGFEVKSIGCGGQHVVVGGVLRESEEGKEISMSNMRKEIHKIEKQKKKRTVQQRMEEIGDEPEEPQKRAKTGGGFFVSAEQQLRVKQSGNYRGVSGMSNAELEQEYKEEKKQEVPTRRQEQSSRPSSGFFVNAAQESRISKGYRGVSGMTEQELNQEYKQEEPSKPEPKSAFSSITPTFGQNAGGSNPFISSSNPFQSTNPFKKEASNPFKKETANPFKSDSANPFKSDRANPFKASSSKQSSTAWSSSVSKSNSSFANPFKKQE